MPRTDERVVVLAPSAHDGPLTTGLLEKEGFECLLVRDVPALAQALAGGAGLALLAEEALQPANTGPLADVLRAQEPWSDLPLVVFTGRGRPLLHPLLGALSRTANVTLLERPIERVTLLSAVRAALRARRRQYAAREVLATLERTTIDLRRSVERYERQVRLFDSIASTTPDFVYLFDAQGRFLYANRRLLEVLGMTLPAIVGKTFLELGYERWHHDRHMREIAEVIATRRPVKGEVPFKAPLTGIFGVYEYIFTPVIGPDGQVEVVAGTTRDVTDRKRSEDVAHEENRRKGEFIAVLSHELRNPLAPIRTGVQLLERAPPGSEQARHAREVIKRQSDHLARLVDDLLDVTRISVGKVELQRARLDLREVARKTTEDLTPVFTQAQVALRFEGAPPQPVWVDGDATRVAQVLGNLLQNAAKFTPPGGTVRVAVAVRDGQAELSVRDDGVGMDPASIEKMFEPFAQGDRTLARAAGGLGLGLSLVRGLVQLHGGTVDARSEGPGRGTEFRVHLPLAGPGAAAPEPTREGNGASRSILVIDDNADGAQTLADLLELHGHRVRVAFDARSGIALAHELRPDVVLCDIGLPDLDGYTVARAVRQDEALGHRTRLVALSGYAQPEDRARSRDAGFDEHLAKPPDVDRLIAALAAGHASQAGPASPSSPGR